MGSTEWIDFYEELEVPFGASFEEIRVIIEHYKRSIIQIQSLLMRKKSQCINIAFEVLSDEEARRVYDETYLQMKNGGCETGEEVPKYSYEEMRKAFTEEQIFFAKKIATSKAISEALENAKIIVDARNELKIGAFKGLYDDFEYQNEYNSFCQIAREYIDNLKSLSIEALKYDLVGGR